MLKPWQDSGSPGKKEPEGGPGNGRRAVSNPRAFSGPVVLLAFLVALSSAVWNSVRIPCLEACSRFSVPESVNVVILEEIELCVIMRPIKSHRSEEICKLLDELSVFLHGNVPGR